ncbi:hypothetical protein JTE90_014966 [Oedothorax gibbosus]|uniref:Uncharacterized protein n=1 Tax=Oedothorax gibbosus TaxID=931172 RepID=A0AAV6UYK3_9ARAC|nr:hypothetical protein JTE90_014966 [Oedothorax gibbosus]
MQVSNWMHFVLIGLSNRETVYRFDKAEALLEPLCLLVPFPPIKSELLSSRGNKGSAADTTRDIRRECPKCTLTYTSDKSEEMTIRLHHERIETFAKTGRLSLENLNSSPLFFSGFSPAKRNAGDHLPERGLYLIAARAGSESERGGCRDSEQKFYCTSNGCFGAHKVALSFSSTL